MTDLPQGWEWARFSDVARVASNLVDPADYGQSPHIAPNHIESETGRLLDYQTVAEDGVTSPKHLFRPGQILYSKIRPYLAKVVTVEFAGLCSADMYPIETDLENRFLKWWMLTRRFTEEASKHEGRSVLPKINVQALSTLPVPVPPLAEQRRIMDALENHLAAIDRGFTSLQVARRKTDFLAIARLDDVFRTMTYARIVRLREILREPLRNGYSGRATTNGRGVRVITLTAVTKNEFTENNSKLCETGGRDVSDLWLERGDILIERANTPELVGTTALYLGDSNWSIFPDLLIRIRVNDEVLPEFLGAALSTSRLREYFKSSAKGLSGTMPKIDQSTVENATLRLPSLDMQREAVDKIQDIDRVAMKLNTDLQLAERKAERLRALLLNEGFAGRLVSQDPDDEPASVLLKRIKAERLAQPKPKRARRNTHPDQECMR